jgi:hypothetical protein
MLVFLLLADQVPKLEASEKEKVPEIRYFLKKQLQILEKYIFKVTFLHLKRGNAHFTAKWNCYLKC